MSRTATVKRTTKETDITAQLSLDGSRKIEIDTGIGFLDHMLNTFAFHGSLDLQLKCKGDLQVDAHHTVEDIGIVLGRCFGEALGDKSGIKRFGNATVPMDEALGWCSLDISGRPFLVFEAEFENPMVGAFDTCLTEEFMRAFAFSAGITLHIKSLYGKNDHHKIESMFKALTYALREACTLTQEGTNSTKGSL